MARVGVPVIDMQKVEGLEEKIVKAFEEWGCFRMVNHGVPPQLLAEMKVVVASLFDLPEDIESQTTYTKHGMGYIRRGLINSFYESLGIGNISSSEDFCDNLDVSTHQRKTIYNYINAIHDLAQHLGRKLMKGNGLEGDLFDGWCCELRMNKYHFCHESVGLLGSESHSDPSFLTILQDDENMNGLQVVDKYSGEFVSLDHVPGTLVVNAGDIGKLAKYLEQREILQCDSQSMLFGTRNTLFDFMLGPTDSKVEAPSNLLDSDHPRLYVPVDYKEYRKVRTSKRVITGAGADLFLVNSPP
ncbi:hypothetical protein M8C21_025364 [Ambrosia artemisiifolia]|uniref:Uncharacterized protein n=1 Tax=Ambrosia artemisiifolia TaxID=4212 RepID=A0AAD5G6J1_AMBAR|nr:hypothetical protein M8C21_025364 [Ambrosia artemisiifolia]